MVVINVPTIGQILTLPCWTAAGSPPPALESPGDLWEDHANQNMNSEVAEHFAKYYNNVFIIKTNKVNTFLMEVFSILLFIHRFPTTFNVFLSFLMGAKKGVNAANF